MSNRLIQHSHHNNKTKIGFSILEIIIYIALVGTILAATTSIAFEIYHGHTKNVSYQSLQNNARFVLSKIVTEIENAQSINTETSIFNSNTGMLSLQTGNSGTNPTLFQIESQRVSIKQGTSASVQLTSADTNATVLRFENLTAPQTPGTVKITLTLTYKDTGNRTELNSSVTLTTTANIRRVI